MAIFHLGVKSISRSSGRSSVAAAAYRAGEKLHDARQDLEFDYSKKKGVVFSEVITPKDAPKEFANRATLWNAVEAIEKRKDARLAQEIMVALPKELSLEDNVELAKRFCQKTITEKGLIADLNIHLESNENPHAHILIPTRVVSENGFGLKHSALRDIHLPKTIRQNWQDITNQKLFELGLETRIDCRSLKKRGIDLIPNLHLGASVSKSPNKEGLDSYIGYREIIDENAKRIIERPEIGLQMLGDKKSYFLETDIAKLASSYSNDLEQYHQVFNAIKGSEKLIALGQNEFGREVFSSKDNLNLELKFLENLARQELTPGFRVKIDHISTINKNLSTKQLQTMAYLTEPGNLKAVIGYAGSGKSTLMDCCREVWEQSGYSVKGGALSGIASASLGQSARITSRTVDSWLYSWDKGRDNLSSQDVFVLDEAGTLCADKFARLAEHTEAHGAKLIVIGDPEQCQPFGKGNPFRTLVNHMDKVAVLDSIYRQQQPEMQQATKLFGEANPKAALAIYLDKGCIHTSSTEKSARGALIEAWAAEKDTNGSSIILAHKNRDVAELNSLARSVRIFNKEIDNGIKFEVLNRKNERLQKEFSPGDKIYFLYNNHELGVKNGTLATIEKIQEKNFSVVLDSDNKKVEFDIGKYRHIDHGYAATIYKSQGISVERTYLYATPDIDRHLGYVACSRHKQSLEMFCSKTDFKTSQELFNSMAKSQQKSLAIDFAYNKNLEPNDNLDRGLANYKTAISRQLELSGVDLTEKSGFIEALGHGKQLVQDAITLGGEKFVELAREIKSFVVERTGVERFFETEFELGTREPKPEFMQSQERVAEPSLDEKPAVELAPEPAMGQDRQLAPEPPVLEREPELGGFER